MGFHHVMVTDLTQIWAFTLGPAGAFQEYGSLGNSVAHQQAGYQSHFISVHGINLHALEKREEAVV